MKCKGVAFADVKYGDTPGIGGCCVGVGRVERAFETTVDGRVVVVVETRIFGLTAEFGRMSGVETCADLNGGGSGDCGCGCGCGVVFG